VRIAWWIGIQRLYIALAGLWVIVVLILGVDEVRQPFRDGQVLQEAIKCEAVQDEQFYGLPEAEQFKVYDTICPDLSKSHSLLSFGASARLRRGEYRGSTADDINAEQRRAVVSAIGTLSAVALGIPLVGYGLLLVARWVARGFLRDRGQPPGAA
jgi:hypothetical protein